MGQSTPKFAKQVSSKHSDLSERKVQKDLWDNHGRKISRNYIQTNSANVNEIIAEREQTWEYVLPQQALEAKIVSLGMDGTTSYVVGQGYRETMSGTISFFNKKGERVHTIYVAQTPEYGKMTFKQRFEREIDIVQLRVPNASYTGVADGASDNWTFLKPKVDNETLDFWHANDYLSTASKVFSTSKSKQTEWFIVARHFLRYQQGGAEELLEDMKSFRRKKMNKTKKVKLEACITYFSNHHHQMNYVEAVEKGLPIGSGVTEAACKVIVKERLCCSGMMWKQPGAQNVLTIRSLTHTNGRWSQFWNLFDLHGRAN